MSGFKDREDGYEAKFAHDEAIEFRAMSRRNRLLGEWAARRMGLENVADYARAVVKSELEHPHDEDVLRKESQDLAASGITVSTAEVHAKMDEFMAVARAQIESEG